MPGLPTDVSHAIDAAIDRFRAMVLSVGARHALRGADVDELLQDVRIRLWRGRANGEEIQALPTSYVYQTAMSAAIDLLRKRRRNDARTAEPTRDILTSVPERGGTADATDLHDLQARVERALRELAPPRRIVVRMSLAGYNRQQIVERLGWTDAKVRNLLSRGMDDLRSLLTRHQGDGTTHER